MALYQWLRPIVPSFSSDSWQAQHPFIPFASVYSSHSCAFCIFLWKELKWKEMEATERFWFLGMGLLARLASLPSRLAFRPFQGFSRHQILPRLAWKQCRRKRPQNLHIETKSEIFRRRPVVDGSVEAPRNLEQILGINSVKIVSRLPPSVLYWRVSGQKLHNVSSASSVQHGQSQIRPFWTGRCGVCDLTFRRRESCKADWKGFQQRSPRRADTRPNNAKYVRCQHHRDAFPRIRELCHDSRGRSWMRAFWEKADKRSDKPPRWVLWWIRKFYDRNPSML